RENGTVTFIYNVLDSEKDKDYYEAIPMTFIDENKRMITISNHKNAYVIDQMLAYLDSHESRSLLKFFVGGLGFLR
nr:magnesium transporter CorA family protein [Streptococcus oralis]